MTPYDEVITSRLPNGNEKNEKNVWLKHCTKNMNFSSEIYLKIKKEKKNRKIYGLHGAWTKPLWSYLN